MSNTSGKVSEKKEIEEPSLFIVVATWESFRDAIKEQ
jgi:hypothetical protein